VKKKYIEDKQTFFWYSPSLKNKTVSDKLLVVYIFNYRSIDYVRELFKVMKNNKAANLFFNSINKSERLKANYNDLKINYYTLLF